MRSAKIFHAGDGNLHSNILFERGNEEDFKRAEAATAEIFRACAELGGTITGEHGVGTEKVKFMSLLYSPADIEAQWKVKSAFDPQGLANPGKVLPERAPRGAEA